MSPALRAAGLAALGLALSGPLELSSATSATLTSSASVGAPVSTASLPVPDVVLVARQGAVELTRADASRTLTVSGAGGVVAVLAPGVQAATVQRVEGGYDLDVREGGWSAGVHLDAPPDPSLVAAAAASSTG